MKKLLIAVLVLCVAWGFAGFSFAKQKTAAKKAAGETTFPTPGAPAASDVPETATAKARERLEENAMNKAEKEAAKAEKKRAKEEAKAEKKAKKHRHKKHNCCMCGDSGSHE